MATLNLGRIKPVFRGAYSGSTAYVVDDIVTHGDESFICIQAHGAGTQATSVTAYWSKLAAKGTDVGTTITTQGDILYRDGSGLQRLAKPASNKFLQNTSGGVLSWESVTEYDDNKIQANIALLGFKTAVNGSLAKYNLVDQIIDEFSDATGIDAGASTAETRSSTAPYYYFGGATSTPSVTTDADVTTVDGDYTYYKWTGTGAGSYVNDTTQDHEWLVVAGGGGAGFGGGGGGGVRMGTTLSLIGGNTYVPTVGAGGSAKQVNGVNSSLSGTGITTITSTGGGAGGGPSGNPGAGAAGGSGGGSGHDPSATGGAATAITQYTAAGETRAIQGYAGGATLGLPTSGGGGGGAGGAGANGDGSVNAGTQKGGEGIASTITGATVYYGGGGGGSYGGVDTAPDNGGGGYADPNSGGSGGTAGTANTGGGAGGGNGTSRAGGSGIIVLRRATLLVTEGADLVLQSTDTTAQTPNPDSADMVVLMEDAAGTATLNTDIKGYVSEDSGVTFTQGTLVDEGTWGTNKKIVAFHDLDISAQTGSAMCYKITTHNQSGAKKTRVHAASIGWK